MPARLCIIQIQDPTQNFWIETLSWDPGIYSFHSSAGGNYAAGFHLSLRITDLNLIT